MCHIQIVGGCRASGLTSLMCFFLIKLNFIFIRNGNKSKEKYLDTYIYDNVCTCIIPFIENVLTNIVEKVKYKKNLRKIQNI